MVQNSCGSVEDSLIEKEKLIFCPLYLTNVTYWEMGLFFLSLFLFLTAVVLFYTASTSLIELQWELPPAGVPW